jgi:hypothetical protein
MVVGPDGARNQERLCWRGPAVIRWTSEWLPATQSVEANVSILRKLTVALLVKVLPTFYVTGNNVAHVVSFLRFYPFVLNAPPSSDNTTVEMVVVRKTSGMASYVMIQ